MKMSRTLPLFFIYSSIAFCLAHYSVCFALSAVLLSEPIAGQSVKATVVSAGDVLVESDISQSSFVAKGSGSRTVDLGNGTKAKLGFHLVRLKEAGKEVSLLVAVLFDSVGTPLPAQSTTSPAEQLLISRFFDNLKANGKTYVSSWPKKKVLTENVVKIATVGSLGVVCATEPTKITCIPFATATADLIAEVIFDYLNHSVDEMIKTNLLTAPEGKTVKKVITALKAAKIAANVGFGNGLFEKALEGLDVVTLAMDDDSIVKLTIGLQKDSAGKALKFIQILEKLK